MDNSQDEIYNSLTNVFVLQILDEYGSRFLISTRYFLYIPIQH
jgi:hypothetical protein